MKCRDGYETSLATCFPNLLAQDTIKSGEANDYYNCASWAGGITNAWFSPPDWEVEGASLNNPWHALFSNQMFDNFFGNNPLRYYGAVTYINTAYSNESKIDLYYIDDEWEHASVKQNIDNIMHGYSWESKLGDSIRIFHNRAGLTGDFYGTQGRYYRPMSRGDEGLSLEESLKRGLTIYVIPELSTGEIEFLNNKLSDLIRNGKLRVFEELYKEWLDSIKSNEELRYKFNTTHFTRMDSFRKLISFVKESDPEGYLAMGKYNERRDVYSQLLFDYCVLVDHKDNCDLASTIREKNNQRSAESLLNGEAYIAPSEVSNTMELIKTLIDNCIRKEDV